MNAVAKPIVARRPRKTRSKYGYLFNLDDEKERRMCHCMSIFHLGRNYQARYFRRVVSAVGGERHRVIFEIVRLRRPEQGSRWKVVTWDIDGPRVQFSPAVSRRAADLVVRQACLHPA